MGFLDKTRVVGEMTRFVVSHKMGKKIRPRTVAIDLTYSCNLTCPMCWRSERDTLELKKIDKREREKLLSPDEWLDIIDRAIEFGNLKSVNLSGGEPTSYPDVEHLVEGVKERGLKGTLVTNGTMLTKDFMEMLVKQKWDVVSVSIDGCERESYEKIRGKGNFDKLSENLKHLKQLKEEYGTELPKVHLAAIIMRNNFERLDCFVDLAEELGCSSVGFSYLYPWSQKGYSKLKVPEDSDEVIRTGLKKAHQKGVDKQIHTNAESVLGLDVPEFCMFIYTTLFMNPFGDVLKCCRMPVKVGNVLEGSLEGIWFGEELEGLRKRFRDGNILEVCKNCSVSNITYSNRVHDLMTLNLPGILEGAQKLIRKS